MPERPKYERIGDEEHGIKMDELRPTHAYVDGDAVVSEPPVTKDTTPIVAAAASPSAVRMPRTPTAQYPLHDDDDYHHPPPPALLPGAGYGSSRSSPVRHDYQSSPVRQTSPVQQDHYNGGAYSSGGGGYSGNHSYDTGYNGGGGYRDDHDAYYENSRGGYSGRNGGYV